MGNEAFYDFLLAAFKNIETVMAKDASIYVFHADTEGLNFRKACTHFIAALCEMAKTQKRVNATEKAVENEKYAFNCFLLRLGFIGPEYKTERKILLSKLTGSSAFKYGQPGHEEVGQQ